MQKHAGKHTKHPGAHPKSYLLTYRKMGKNKIGLGRRVITVYLWSRVGVYGCAWVHVDVFVWRNTKNRHAGAHTALNRHDFPVIMAGKFPEIHV